MSQFSDDSVNALMSAFVDQVAEDFIARSVRIDDHHVLVAAGDSAISAGVHFYSQPSEAEPERPYILRITGGTRNEAPEKYLRQLGFSKGTRGAPYKLELNVLPAELSGFAPWLVSWILWQSGETDYAPEPRHVGLSSQFELSDERGDCYAWTEHARYTIELWQASQRARQADETQFIQYIHKGQYPTAELPIRAPSFRSTAFPDDWVSSNDVRVVNGFRPGRDLGRYLTGPAVEERLAEACQSGYIVLPDDWKKSDRWGAWKATWWETCQMPRYRRPYIALTVGKEAGVFGRLLTLRWDYITMDPKDDVSTNRKEDPRVYPPGLDGFDTGWQAMFQRIDQYLKNLPAPGAQALCSGPLGESIYPSFGQIVVGEKCDAPLQFVFDWMATLPPYAPTRQSTQ